MNGFASVQYLHVFQCCADLGPGRYGSVPHAGFGVGFERLVMLATGVTWCMSWEGGWVVKVLAKRNLFNGKNRKRPMDTESDIFPNLSSWMPSGRNMGLWIALL